MTEEEPSSEGELIEERREEGELRYYLCGKRVHDGDELELRVSRPRGADTKWLSGMFEFDTKPLGKIPSFTFYIPTEYGADTWKVRFQLRSQYSFFRWPKPCFELATEA